MKLFTAYCPVQPEKKRGISLWWLTWASQVALVVRSLPAYARYVRNMGLIPELGWCPKDPANHSNILDSRTPWTEESCHLRSTGSHKIVHNWSNLAQHTCLEFQATISWVRVSFFFLTQLCKTYSMTIWVSTVHDICLGRLKWSRNPGVILESHSKEEHSLILALSCPSP